MDTEKEALMINDPSVREKLDPVCIGELKPKWCIIIDAKVPETIRSELITLLQEN